VALGFQPCGSPLHRLTKESTSGTRHRTSSVWLGAVGLHAGGLFNEEPLGVVPGPGSGGGGQEAGGQAEATQQAPHHHPHLPAPKINCLQLNSFF